MSGTKDIAEYTAVMKNVLTLLKPGGYFIEIAAIACPFYEVGGKKFSCVCLKQGDVLTAFKESNVEVLQTFDETVVKDDADPSKSFGSFVVLGKKL